MRTFRKFFLNFFIFYDMLLCFLFFYFIILCILFDGFFYDSILRALNFVFSGEMILEYIMVLLLLESILYVYIYVISILILPAFFYLLGNFFFHVHVRTVFRVVPKLFDNFSLGAFSYDHLSTLEAFTNGVSTYFSTC